MNRKATRVPVRQGGRPTREDSERKTAQLLQSAAAIFIREGYAGTSVAKIATAADIGKPTIYARFGNKAKLFSRVVAHILDNHLLTVEESPETGDPVLGLKNQLSHILAASIDPLFVGLFRLFLTEAHKFPEIYVAFNELSEGSVRSLTPHLLRIQKARKVTIPIADIANMLLALTNKLVMMESVLVTRREAIVPGIEASKMVDAILFGVVAR